MRLIKTKTKSIKVKVHVERFIISNGSPAVWDVKVYGNLSPEEAMLEVFDYAIGEPSISLRSISFSYAGRYDEVIDVPMGDFINIAEEKYGKVLNGESQSDVSIRPEEGTKESGESGESEVGQA